MSLATQISQAVQAACALEASAPKPGNVSPAHPFTDTTYEDFLLSAVAIGPAMGRAGAAALGETIERAVCSTRRWTPSNTNLGMILLLAPLAKACLSVPNFEHLLAGPRLKALRAELKQILENTTTGDARRVYAAIRAARAGGLGVRPEADISSEPDISLYQAMQLAQGWDTIAREYVTGFAVTFEIAFPAFENAWCALGEYAPAVVQAYLQVLAQVPDTLIRRKLGEAAARQVSAWAADVLEAGGVFSESGRNSLAVFDRRLRDKKHARNPGTTADLIAAALFLHFVVALDAAEGPGSVHNA